MGEKYYAKVLRILLMISIRKTTADDVKTLWEIERAAFLPLFEKYRDSGNPALRDETDISRRIGGEYFSCFTILFEEKIVGGLWYKIKGACVEEENLGDGIYYLQRVFIDPSFQSRGIAQKAILLSEAYFEDAKILYVDFPEDLAKNRRCYEKAGYRDTGKRVPVQEGLVLACFEKKIG